jgi:hypothetical protein
MEDKMAKSMEQLEFPGIKLGELVRELIAVQEQKKEANEEFNADIKSLQKQIKKIAYEMGNVKQ